MARRLGALLTVLALSAGGVVVTGGFAAPTAAQETPHGQGHDGGVDLREAARAWILADAETGTVLAAHNAHTPLYVASLVKVLTAFTALERIEPGTKIRVSKLAAAQPAMRIGMEAGQEWEFTDALHALLMVSANDAAYALAEAAAGDLESFSRLMAATARRLGATDGRFLDPAGFDGTEGFGGGTRASAYDLAVVARNALEVPEIRRIARTRVYEFKGGDGRPHRLRNHNKMLDTFPGLTGLKTGYTRAAGHTLIATASRGDRHLVAVVLDARGQRHYDVAAALLEQGFATDPSTRGTGEVLPPTRYAPRATGPGVPAPAPARRAGNSDSPALTSVVLRTLVGLVLLLTTLVVLRRRAVVRRRRQRLARRRAYLDAKRRGMIEVVDAGRYFGTGHVTVLRPEEDLWPPEELRRRPTGQRS